MRITIDTDKNVIICPNAFWSEVQKRNDLLKEVGATEKIVSHKEIVKQYFEKAIENELVRPADTKKK